VYRGLNVIFQLKKKSEVAMFEVGTKIIVIKSSCRKPALGPRIGSIGYFSAIEGLGKANGDAISLLASVNFTRYGFEKKLRSERRKVVFVFPTIEEGKGDIQQQVHRVGSKITSTADKHKAWRKNILDYYDMSRTGLIALVAPMVCSAQSVMDYDIIEFKAWAESILLNQNFEMFLNEALMSKHITRATDGRISNLLTLSTLRSAIANREYRQELLAPSANAENRKKMAELLTILKVLSIKRRREGEIRDILGMIPHICNLRNGEINRSAVYEISASFLFETVVPMALNEMADQLKSKQLKLLLEDIYHTRAAIMGLSTRLVAKSLKVKATA
jgi:hypothetical protein